MLSGPLAPLRCAELSERLSELIDGERDPAALARVRLHVSGCPACARLALELLATVEAMHGLSRSASPPPGWLHSVEPLARQRRDSGSRTARHASMRPRELRQPKGNHQGSFTPS